MFSAQSTPIRQVNLNIVLHLDYIIGGISLHHEYIIGWKKTTTLFLFAQNSGHFLNDSTM